MGSSVDRVGVQGTGARPTNRYYHPGSTAMKIRPFVLAVAALAATPFLAAAPRASADVITLQFLGGANTGSPLSIKLNGVSDSVGGGPFSWAQIQDPVNGSLGSPLLTFCVDLTKYINDGTQNPNVSKYTITTPITGLAAIGGNATEAAAVNKLFAQHYDTNWETTPIGSFTSAQKDASKAFQLALWNILYDTDKTLAGGTFSSTSSAATTATTWLQNLNKASTPVVLTNFELVGLTGAENKVPNTPAGQDQIVVKHTNPVPAPPALFLAAFGLVALGGRASWLRKKAAV